MTFISKTPSSSLLFSFPHLIVVKGSINKGVLRNKRQKLEIGQTFRTKINSPNDSYLDPKLGSIVVVEMGEYKMLIYHGFF